MTRVKLSVLVLAYNHEAFIEKALQGVLCQKTSFKIEIVIGEDCSQDRTREIASDYQRRYPDVIRLIPSRFNVGMRSNFIRTYRACQGEYIALLDGDDYWTVTDKLQRQVELLDNHPSLIGCFHPVNVLHEPSKKIINSFPPLTWKDITITEDLFEGNLIPTCSVVYRNGKILDFPNRLFEHGMMDWPFHILHSQQGNIGFVREVMGVYRVHARGCWSSQERHITCLRMISLLQSLGYYVSESQRKKIRKAISTWSNLLFNDALNAIFRGFYFVGVKNAIIAIKTNPYCLIQPRLPRAIARRFYSRFSEIFQGNKDEP